MAGNIMVVRHEAHSGVSGTFTAAAEIGAAVKVSGEKSFAPAGAADQVVGVSHHKVASGEKGTVRIKGDIIPMVAAGAIAAGAVVEIAAGGKVQTKDTGAAYGVAWTAAAGDGSQVNIIVL